MGVWIRESQTELVKDKEAQDILHYVMGINWMRRTPIKTDDELIAKMDNYVSRVLKNHGDNGEVSLFDAIAKLGNTLDGAIVKKCLEYLMMEGLLEEQELPSQPDTDYLYERSAVFPHWYGRTVWDGTNQKITTNNNPIAFSSYIGENVDMSYGFYNHLRSTISETLLGNSPRQVWGLNFHHAYKSDEFKRNIYLLVNGSDCEGVIVPEVVKKIASSLGSQRARKSYHENNSEYDIEYFDQLVKVFVSAANNGRSIEF